MTNGAARAPLLAVVGGPTGAGKSTLLNSLVRAPVSAAGVLRPTTRRPVLVCNPRDWASVRRHGLRPICAPLMPEGIAVIDVPDVDSIEAANRALADELFAEADLWLFVTTASRYADEANWRHLRAARARRVALAVVLDRVAAGHAHDIIDHMRDLLGPPEPPLFVIPEAPLDRQGMLPDSIAAPLRGWLADVVAAARSGPPQPAIGVAHVPAENIADPADLAGPGESAGGDAGLTVELELTTADAVDRTDGVAPSGDAETAEAEEVAAQAAAPDTPETPPTDPGGGSTEGGPDSTLPDGDGDGVPDTELSPAAPLTSDDVEAAEVAEGAAGVPDVVESDPPDGRPDRPPADIPKAADVGETVKL